jgi:hypothetical protein
VVDKEFNRAEEAVALLVRGVSVGMEVADDRVTGRCVGCSGCIEGC